MEHLRQIDIAEALDISKPTASRLLRALGRSALPPTDLDVVKALAVGELAKLGFTPAVGVELLTELESEVQYLFGNTKRRCWVVFVERDDLSFRRAALSKAYLEGLLDSIGMALVIPLHRIVEDARADMERIKRRKSRRAAA